MPRTRTPDARSSAADLDQAAVGNGRVLALVSPRGSLDWLCLPRFDAPSVFARLLDEEHGGRFRVLRRGVELEGRLSYLQNTNVARVEFRDGDDVWELLDFAPRIPEGLGIHVPIEHVRLLRPIRGEPRLSVDFDPRPGYAAAPVELRESTRGLDVVSGHGPITLQTNLPVPYVLGKREFALTRPTWFSVRWNAAPDRRETAGVLRDLEVTIAGWRAWARSCALPSFAPSQVLRSALVLKLHTYHDTGAIIAATTTSVPESLGTQRTWDYRYCWLRDAAFVVEALRRLSHVAEGEQLLRFLRDLVEAGPLQPVYGIGGERDLEERLLPHLAGFAGNGHVRVGNAAAIQQQNDLMGEIVLCFDTMLSDPRVVIERPDVYWPALERLVEDALRVAREPDMSIWEFRTLMRRYTFSLALCAVAAQRGARLAERLGRHEHARRWARAGDELRAELLERGFNRELGFFTQGLDGVHPDASNLLLPSLGLIDARDPRFVSTLRAYEERLVEGGMMMRYRNDDDFGATTSTFTICSFWWAEALAMVGELDRARELFQQVVAHENPVGLFSEDVDPLTGRLLGNFPQAYTHVGLIHAATTIGELLDARDGQVRAWCCA
ncbi:MAG: glycoside hydrolase family 15 protein [Planctomycetes bacterium]|nr:glycoside hydrolase family 15 protein [Planctomycetota bacterium]